jgi:hypothetical protein
MTEQLPIDPDQYPTADDPDSAAPDTDESEQWDAVVPDELLPKEEQEEQEEQEEDE